MKAVKIVLACFVAGFLLSSCTKTDYITAPVAQDTTKKDIVIIENGLDSAIDLYVNGEFYSPIFAHQDYDTLKVAAGSVLELQWMQSGEYGLVESVCDTVVVSDSGLGAGYNTRYWSNDTLLWHIY
jgi:hypothetical protein